LYRNSDFMLAYITCHLRWNGRPTSLPLSLSYICSVCWDTFKFPKLLPCKHTFCLSCLHEFLEGLQDKSNLVCPLCREPCYVPEKGFSDFPTNYYEDMIGRTYVYMATVLEI
jgi:tripartite motif-containing protein 56